MTKSAISLEKKLDLLYAAAKKNLNGSNIQYASRHIAAAVTYCRKADKEVPRRFMELAAKVIQADYEMSAVLGAK